ncbi:MAG: Fe2+-dependent dioxygenase [Lysobacterales bacterium 69-70]|nr:Fe2+-dependent dioxygenase [Xanthomonadaceae bacterium]ODU34607.1 MAG: Fe2+-dependent dioxygenase [Xanthomonadaceae bacterium SCN 69-320]ODV19460.1 MAG: Fe2+-dependent dioxygenase [Xanthomonadaceae bacterium SCN 69-25]OJY94670.1 MAG: Fe2+-dependent dioxygenase [Xanthomonadales bacterium 69-70]
MLLHVANVLTPEEVAHCRRRLDTADWLDGRLTAGYQSAKAKHNLQLADDSPVARELGALILDKLQRHPTFVAGALPRRIFPPLFNCYREGQAFGFHVDNAVRYPRTGDDRSPLRTDLSATLFLNDPDDYDGGDLVVEDSFGTHSVKLPAGDLILYPASSLHQVQPITRGERIASFFWIQSLVRDEGERRLLFDLDLAIQNLTPVQPEHPALVSLVGVYHNLLRRWSEA